MKSQTSHFPPLAPSNHVGTRVKVATSEKLNELALLKAGWDCYGAPPIERKIIDAAIHFVSQLPDTIHIQPRVVPTSAGGLQLEWHDGPRVLELEFENPQEIRFLRWHPQAAIEEEDSFSAKDINRAVELIHWHTHGPQPR